ncbi:MAG: YmfQ family protein [Treponema sp.]|jgi:uncharacterized protein YmfQ (DUF2313 family)|nr:YmfQ family protein [Treponema sp.]
MGLVATATEYAAALQKLFPQGDYWDTQFANPESDVSRFCQVKAVELIRFRERMNALQSESIIETTHELIADWERVLLGHNTNGLDLEQRRLFLLSNRDVSANRVELQKIAGRYGLSITDITFPYKPAFFGFSRFNQRICGPIGFSVLLFVVQQSEPKEEQLIRDFEQEIAALMLANQIISFKYEGV